MCSTAERPGAMRQRTSVKDNEGAWQFLFYHQTSSSQKNYEQHVFKRADGHFDPDTSLLAMPCAASVREAYWSEWNRNSSCHFDFSARDGQYSMECSDCASLEIFQFFVLSVSSNASFVSAAPFHLLCLPFSRWSAMLWKVSHFSFVVGKVVSIALKWLSFHADQYILGQFASCRSRWSPQPCLPSQKEKKCTCAQDVLWLFSHVFWCLCPCCTLPGVSTSRFLSRGGQNCRGIWQSDRVAMACTWLRSRADERLATETKKRRNVTLACIEITAMVRGFLLCWVLPPRKPHC